MPTGNIEDTTDPNAQRYNVEKFLRFCIYGGVQKEEIEGVIKSMGDFKNKSNIMYVMSYINWFPVANDAEGGIKFE
ncbi:MAG: hypothetical protein LBB16_01780 [Puniceicoccales bacterium]|jgi:hypothetical protein|nr:hypothetical protein [Puniceicoccales bacterium]